MRTPIIMENQQISLSSSSGSSTSSDKRKLFRQQSGKKKIKKLIYLKFYLFTFS
jgi:hypothetical protein